MTATLPVLNFHDVGPARTNGSYPAALLQRCLRLLRSRGFQTVELCRSVDKLGRGELLPDRSIAITFDDGYRSVYEVAFPLLLELGYTATLFLATGCRTAGRSTVLPSLGGQEMLRWTEVGEMMAAGFSVGSHSVSHSDMRGLPAGALARELSESKHLLEDRLGAGVESFAYPFGRYNARVQGAVQEHYGLAFSDHLSLIDGGSDQFGLPRIDMAFFNRVALQSLLSSSVLHAYLRVRRRLWGVRRTPRPEGRWA